MGVMGRFGLKKMQLKIDEIYTFYCLYIVESHKRCKFQLISSSLQREHLKELKENGLPQQQFLEHLFEAQRELETREKEANRNLLPQIGKIIFKKWFLN